MNNKRITNIVALIVIFAIILTVALTFLPITPFMKMVWEWQGGNNVISSIEMKNYVQIGNRIAVYDAVRLPSDNVSGVETPKIGINDACVSNKLLTEYVGRVSQLNANAEGFNSTVKCNWYFVRGRIGRRYLFSEDENGYALWVFGRYLDNEDIADKDGFIGRAEYFRKMFPTATRFWP